MAIYLDSASTTKIKPEVLEAMMPYFTDKYYNPSSLYSPAMQIKHDIEYARKVVGDFINADSDEIFFTSSGSEANCWAIQGFLKQNYGHVCTQHTIITSAIEHKSISDCVKDYGYNRFIISVDKDGFVDLVKLEDLLKRASLALDNKVLVSVQMANNEIGTIQPIKRIAELVHKYKGIFHVDAVQAFGHISIDVKDMEIDMLSVSGHKIGCPKGVGILYKRKDIKIRPLIYGSQMDGMRGSTENVPYIMGMAKAVELCNTNNDYISDLREYFIFALEDKFGCKVNGDRIQRLPNNINVTFHQNITGEALLYMLDTAGIQIGVGSACNSRSIQPSHVLKAIGLSDDEASRTIRITLSEDTTVDEIDETIEQIDKAIKLLTMEDYDCEL